MKADVDASSKKILEFFCTQDPSLDFTSRELEKLVNLSQSSVRSAIAHLLNEDALYTVSRKCKGKGFGTPHYRLRLAKDPAPLISRYREPRMKIYKVPVQNRTLLVDPLSDLSSFEVNRVQLN